jgi:hypothetical protein
VSDATAAAHCRLHYRRVQREVEKGDSMGPTNSRHLQEIPVAKRNVTTLIDDLTGKELADGTGETVNFSLDGVRYELDVNSRGAQRLRSVFAPYVKAGRRIAGGRSKRAVRHSRIASDPAAVRAWANSHGIPVSNRGRVPAAVTAQFEAAGN